MFCKFCGEKLAENASFCSGCGKPTTNQSVQVISEQRSNARWNCPLCGATNIQYQTIAEAKKTGCLTVLGYILLAITCIGIFIVIPLMLRKKTVTATYAVCQSCGHRWRVS